MVMSYSCKPAAMECKDPAAISKHLMGCKRAGGLLRRSKVLRWRGVKKGEGVQKDGRVG